LVPDIALSTMWMQKRFERPCDFFTTAVEMGFRTFELTSVAGSSFNDDVHPGEFDIRSLHDPAPGGMEPGDMRKQDIVFTSLDEERRQQAVTVAKNSIDTAVRYGAKAIILHIGHSEADPALQDRLEMLCAAGGIASPEAHDLMARLASGRMVRYEEHMDALMRSLDELVPYAAARDIRLGMENRRHIHEIPNFEEMARLLAHYPDSTIGYWHDVGHAETLANAGMTPHADWLRAYGSRVVGMHLHDVVGFTDHQAPGTGVIDWQGLASLVPSNGLRTAEIKGTISPEAVCVGVDQLLAQGWIHADGRV
jgi:sugar phosphate isomerase/epimerase